MGYLKYVKEAWKKPRENLKDAYKDRLFKFSLGFFQASFTYFKYPIF
jgi:hypothetical protein